MLAKLQLYMRDTSLHLSRQTNHKDLHNPFLDLQFGQCSTIANPGFTMCIAPYRHPSKLYQICGDNTQYLRVCGHVCFLTKASRTGSRTTGRPFNPCHCKSDRRVCVNQQLLQGAVTIVCHLICLSRAVCLVLLVHLHGSPSLWLRYDSSTFCRVRLNAIVFRKSTVLYTVLDPVAFCSGDRGLCAGPPGSESKSKSRY